MKNILITRSSKKCQKILPYLQKHGCETIFQPLFSVKKNFFSTSEISPLKTHAKNIIISSANAIFILKHLNISKNTKIFAVGTITANKIKKLGYKNVVHPNKSSGEDLMKLIVQQDKNQEFLYFHGEKISFDFNHHLQKNQYIINSFKVYSTREIKKFSQNLMFFIKNHKFDEVFIFSQNSLNIFFNNIIDHNLVEYFKSSKIICMSKKIASNAKKIGFLNVDTFANHHILSKFYDTR